MRVIRSFETDGCLKKRRYWFIWLAILGSYIAVLQASVVDGFSLNP
jgi:hypothetical protein